MLSIVQISSNPEYRELQRSQFEGLPEELILYVFQFVEDTDLQSLIKVSPQMRRLASDMILWKHFRLVRNADMLTSRLFGQSRPSRLSLLDKNVLKGVHAHQVLAGTYINGPGMRSMHETQNRLQKIIKQTAIRHVLRRRPERSDLENRGVLPVSKDGAISPALQPRIAELQKALQHTTLTRKLFKGNVKKALSAPSSTESLLSQDLNSPEGEAIMSRL
ncbi:hypothetical protein MP638_003211 [Amoeboaphelidium occidentale]|nr:hypothetical protein MP638_003211 [Amoeboaphelidium occidentale]